MTYLFHEPVRALIPSRPDALSPGLALGLAIVATTMITVALAAVAR